jgi:hypothetical protein
VRQAIVRALHEAVERRRIPAPHRATLRGVLTKVFQPSGHVPQDAYENVHRRRLDVPPGLPPRERVLPEPEKPSQLGLGEGEPFAQGTDVLAGQKTVLTPVQIGGTLPQPSCVVGAEQGVVTLRAREVGGVGHADVLAVDGKGELAPLLLHGGPANGAGVGDSEGL